jgi:hypothetical protein
MKKQSKKRFLLYGDGIFLLLFIPALFYFFPKKMPVTTTPVQKVEQIDTLDYFLSDHPERGLKGTHPLSQTVDGNAVYYVKWSDKNYEYYTWDNAYIYLKEDHSSAPNLPYTFTPGKWMKRFMRVGESITAIQGENKIQFFDSACNPIHTNSGPYKYIMTLEKHIPDFDTGGDLGIQDVIVLTYDYRPAGATNYEKYYYSKEWGWIKWENVDPAGHVLQTSNFNNMTSKVIAPVRDVSCL